jgi:protein arginine N-methyltransferase 1
MAEVLDAVVTRELRAGGRVVPLRMRTHFAAIEFDGEGWGLWGEDFLGYRLDEVQQCVAPQAQLHFFQHHPNLLSEPVRILDSADGQAAGRPRAGHRLRIERPGQLHAIMGYFTVDLTDDVSLSNFPSYPGCNWAVWIWPLKHIRVEAGDEVRMQIRRPSGPGGVRLATSWRLECGVVRQRRL